jgi:hypothetical protein
VSVVAIIFNRWDDYKNVCLLLTLRVILHHSNSRVVGVLPFRDKIIVMVAAADGKRCFLESSYVRRQYPEKYIDFLENRLKFEP